MVGEPENQFSLTPAALRTGGRAKDKSLPVHWNLKGWVTLAAGLLSLAGASGAGTNYSVFPIATNLSLVEAAGGGAFDGTNFLLPFLVGQSHSSATNLVTQLIAPDGSLIGGQTNLGAATRLPNAAFGVTNYLITYRNDPFNTNAINVFGQFVSRAGAKVGGPFPLTKGTGTNTPQRDRSVSFDGTNYFFLWHNTAGANFNFYGQLISQAGGLVGAPTSIGVLGNDGTDTALIFDPSNSQYVAAWYTLRANGVERDVFAAVFSRAGAILHGPVQLNQTVSNDRNGVTLAFDGTNYLCAWSQDAATNSVLTTCRINGRFISSAGALVGSELTFASSTTYQVFPGLAFDGANYLLTWDDAYGTTNANLKFQFLNRSAQPIGVAFTLFSAQQGTNAPVLGLPFFDGARLDAYSDLVSLKSDGSFLSGQVYGAFFPRSTARPVLLSVPPVTNAQFHLRVQGTPGMTYAVLESTNVALTNSAWSALTTNSPTNAGSFDYVDTHATNASRFYQAKLISPD